MTRACQVVALLTTLLISFGSYAQATRAKLWQPTELRRWTQAEDRLVAELHAAGVSLERAPLRVASSQALVRSLELGGFGQIAVVLEGTQGVAYLGLGGGAGVRRIVAPDVKSEVAADTLVLSLVELLNTHALRIDLPTPEARRQAPALAEPPAPLRALALSVEFGPFATTGLSRPAWVLALGVHVPISALWGAKFELLGHYTTVPALSVSAAGRAEVRTLDARAYLLAPLLSSARSTWDLGLGAGALRASAEVAAVNADSGFGIAPNANDTTAIILSARTRFAFWLTDGFGVLVAAEPGIIVPELQIFASSERVSRLGRLWINAQLGVALGI